jgi:hypothetical protein
MAVINECFTALFCFDQVETTVNRPLTFFIKALIDVILELSDWARMGYPVWRQYMVLYILGIGLFVVR